MERSVNTTTVDRFWEEAVRLKSEGEKELELLLGQRSQLDEDIRKLRQYLRVITPPDLRKRTPRAVKAGQTVKAGQQRKKSDVAPTTLRQYADAALTIDKERFDVYDLAEAVGARSVDAARKSAERLRTLGMLRPAGKERGPNQTSGMPRQQYSILNRSILDQLTG